MKKRIRALSLIGIIVSGLGIYGGFVLISDRDIMTGLIAILVYGFFLWFSIEVRSTKKIKKK